MFKADRAGFTCGDEVRSVRDLDRIRAGHGTLAILIGPDDTVRAGELAGDAAKSIHGALYISQLPLSIVE